MPAQPRVLRPDQKRAPNYPIRDIVVDSLVIRSTGTTTERYTVDVDDCGEPGGMDTFGIKTDRYANGPSKLIGGNIQIPSSPQSFSL
ncbi:MAG TPA: hypothetical protein VGJ78_25835 [Vicinamibacterales bacterium]